MMKSLLVTAMVFGLASSASSIGAAGSAFGTLTTADPMGQGRASFGAGIGLADATSFSGVLTYGLSQYMDGRVKLGLVDADGGDTKFAVGAERLSIRSILQPVDSWNIPVLISGRFSS